MLEEDDAEEAELEAFDQALEDIKEFTQQQAPFFCNDIHTVMKEKDQLQKKILDLIAKQEKDKQDYIKEAEKKIAEALEKQKKETEQKDKAHQEELRKKDRELIDILS